MASGLYDDTMESETLGELQTVQQLPPNLMLLRMENETIMSAAAVRPREPLKIVSQLKELIEAYPAAADEAIYSKPVGKVTRVTCGNDRCRIQYEVNKVDGDTVCPTCNSREKDGMRKVQKFAEGLSIRAAESIRSIFGYTRMATTCEILENGDARISGTLVDYSAGNMTSDERIVSRRYKAYGGEIVETPIDRFVNVVIKAEKAKLRRDVILDSTPGIIKAMFRDACEKKLLDLITPEQITQVIIPEFVKFGINAAELDEIIGRPHSMGWEKEDRVQCRKILEALKSGETTKAELLFDLDTRNSASAGQSKVKPSKLNQEPQRDADEIKKQDAQGVDQRGPEDDGNQMGDPSKPTEEELAEMERQASGRDESQQTEKKPAGRRSQKSAFDTESHSKVGQ